MRVWEAQIGVEQRVYNLYYNYVEITGFHFTPNESIVEMPNFDLLMYLTGRKKKKASEFYKNMQIDAVRIADEIRHIAPTSPPSPAMEEIFLRIMVKSFDKGGLEILKGKEKVLAHALALGVCLGEYDQKRRGERPVVALGIHDEARKILQENTDEQLFGFAYSMFVHRGFFGTRAELLKKD